ncbi:MAG: PAS domain-containing protein [Deltaproteobacteria bacterium]
MAHFHQRIQFLPEKTRQIYSYLPAVIFASVATAFILSYVLRDGVPHQLLGSWLAAVVILNLLRQLSLLAFNKSEKKEADLPYWLYLYLAGLFFSGLIWGVTGIIIFPAHSVSHQIFVAFVLGGMVAGSIASTSILRFGFYIFSIPAILPITVRFLYNSNGIQIGMGIMCVIFLACCLYISTSFHSSAVDLLIIRQQKDEEIERRRKSEYSLKQHKDELEKLVAERTQDLERINEELRVEIIEKQNTEKALKESENKLKNIFNSSIPICITNTDYEIVLSNDSYRNIFDSHASKGSPLKCYDSRPGPACDTDACPLKRVLSGEKEVICEPTKINADGSKQYFIVTARPFLDGKGQVTGIVESFPRGK